MTTAVQIECPKYLNITMADAFYNQLKSLLERQVSVVLDATEVEKVDSSGLQMIYAFSQALTQQGGVMSWKRPPHTLVAQAQLIGIAAALGLNTDGDDQ